MRSCVFTYLALSGELGLFAVEFLRTDSDFEEFAQLGGNASSRDAWRCKQLPNDKSVDEEVRQSLEVFILEVSADECKSFHLPISTDTTSRERVCFLQDASRAAKSTLR